VAVGLELVLASGLTEVIDASLALQEVKQKTTNPARLLYAHFAGIIQAAR
jgi:hypothetical protein